MKQLFIAWVPFQRRSISMKSYFGYELKFLSFSFKSRLLRPLEYIIKGSKTLVFFLSQRPQIIWIQLPPTPLLHVAHLYKLLFSHQVKIIADCHNATFRSPWIKFPGTVTLLNRCNLLLIHNDSVKDQAVVFGVSREKLFVLEDPPMLVNDSTVTNDSVITNYKLFDHPWILCPCSFNEDEPIQAVFDAARLAPQITFVITGNTLRAQGIHDLSNIPNNVKLTGFLPEPSFKSLLCETDIVLGLTKLEGVQLSVASEAVGYGKPMVLANTEILKNLFHKGTIYADALDAQSIAQSCKQALSRQSILADEVCELREERSKYWLSQVKKLDKLDFLV